ncbi:hypothetical protein NsoK4_07280 [Nitrosopumilus sp. K4]|uniref:hypothetical protein n=1 Tax=Nitrosopumilus sp. K4 TaxID=2795383 RepID=UPI001BAC2BD5|nr:hypothetical protein [Nitrosopumilus sp. K4]QUC64237.1 hypothetical protein NsoK4_07280 [Nitrosopumilus sp. K4]
MIILNKENEDMPVCDTCKRQIEFLPYRIVTVEDNDMRIWVLHFHYFFPCWDLDYFFQNHANDKIVAMAYSCDADIIKNPMVVRNYKQNMDLWT